MARNKDKYPLEKIFKAADLATQNDPKDLPKLFELLKDSDSVQIAPVLHFN